MADLTDLNSVIWPVDELCALRRPVPNPVVALGTFDGVHLAHQAIVARAVEAAGHRLGTPVAFTFDRHPLALLRPPAPPLLCPMQVRLALLRQAGIAWTIVARFDRQFSAMEPERFVWDVLVRSLGTRAVVAGYNYTFGRGGRGDMALLERLAGEGGFDLIRVPKVDADGVEVSSTAIRRLLSAGEVGSAARLLGRPYALFGRVAAGEGRGHKLGFPTANLVLDEGVLVPAEGVYLSSVAREAENGRSFLGHGLTVISTKPTFGEGAQAIETFILDFDGDLYGERLVVTFRERLRGIETFRGVEALKRQIEADVAAARRLLG